MTCSKLLIFIKLIHSVEHYSTCFFRTCLCFVPIFLYGNLKRLRWLLEMLYMWKYHNRNVKNWDFNYAALFLHSLNCQNKWLTGNYSWLTRIFLGAGKFCTKSTISCMSISTVQYLFSQYETDVSLSGWFMNVLTYPCLSKVRGWFKVLPTSKSRQHCCMSS